MRSKATVSILSAGFAASAVTLSQLCAPPGVWGVESPDAIRPGPATMPATLPATALRGSSAQELSAEVRGFKTEILNKLEEFAQRYRTLEGRTDEQIKLFENTLQDIREMARDAEKRVSKLEIEAVAIRLELMNFEQDLIDNKIRLTQAAALNKRIMDALNAHDLKVEALDKDLAQFAKAEHLYNAVRDFMQQRHDRNNPYPDRAARDAEYNRRMNILKGDYNVNHDRAHQIVRHTMMDDAMWEWVEHVRTHRTRESDWTTTTTTHDLIGAMP